MKNIWNILLIGKTGKGKSALANVLLNQKAFEESAGGISETRTTQHKSFEHKGITYRIIDTVGIGDTKLTKEEVLGKLVPNDNDPEKKKLNQVLFVTSGRFDEKEIEAFNLLKKVIFDDEKVLNFVSIIRTHFPDFSIEEECKKDVEKMINENNKLKEIIKSCGEKVIHLDNPPLKGRSAEINEEIREESRNKMLKYLEECKETYEIKRSEKIKKSEKEFDLLLGEILRKISDNFEILNNNAKEMDDFIIEREKIIEGIKKHQFELKNNYKESQNSFLDSSKQVGNFFSIGGGFLHLGNLLMTFPPNLMIGGDVITSLGWSFTTLSEVAEEYKEHQLNELFWKLVNEDKKNARNFFESWKRLTIFDENLSKNKPNIYTEFSESELFHLSKDFGIGKEKVETVDQAINELSRIITRIDENFGSINQERKFEYSSIKVVGKILFWGFFRGPIMSAYEVAKGEKEKNQALISLSDMDNAIKGLKKELGEWKRKKISLENIKNKYEKQKGIIELEYQQLENKIEVSPEKNRCNIS